MESIEHIFSDHKGNQLMAALSFYDSDEKVRTLKIPEEYADIDIQEPSIVTDMHRSYILLPHILKRNTIDHQYYREAS